jgi:ketosteroid isomerase-like protein
MRERVTAAVYLATAFVVGSSCSSAAGHGQPVAAQIRAVDDARDEALRKGDVVALGKLYADDFVMITSTGQIRSKGDQLRDISARTIEHQGPRERILALQVRGDVAVIHAESEPNTLVVSGVPDPKRRRYTRVYARRGGTWQLLATHISVVAEAP